MLRKSTVLRTSIHHAASGLRCSNTTAKGQDSLKVVGWLLQQSLEISARRIVCVQYQNHIYIKSYKTHNCNHKSTHLQCKCEEVTYWASSQLIYFKAKVHLQGTGDTRVATLRTRKKNQQKKPPFTFICPKGFTFAFTYAIQEYFLGVVLEDSEAPSRWK